MEPWDDEEVGVVGADPGKNEAANLRECLATVAFADEIVVIDSGSTDGTQEIAREAGAQVVQFAWNGEFPRKKNWALGECAVAQ